MSIAKLIDKIHKEELYWSVVKLVGYGAFPFRELASRMKPLVEKHGAKKVSSALCELCSHVGWLTRLNPEGRKAAWGVLGPAPEQWEWFYTDGLGNPTPRPEHHKEPPIILELQPDPILDGLTRLTATELDMKLRLCRTSLKKEVPDHERQLCKETIPRVESEMVRRGEDVPPEEKDKPKTEDTPKKKRTKKEKA